MGTKNLKDFTEADQSEYEDNYSVENLELVLFLFDPSLLWVNHLNVELETLKIKRRK